MHVISVVCKHASNHVQYGISTLLLFGIFTMWTSCVDIIHSHVILIPCLLKVWIDWVRTPHQYMVQTGSNMQTVIITMKWSESLVTYIYIGKPAKLPITCINSKPKHLAILLQGFSTQQYLPSSYSTLLDSWQSYTEEGGVINLEGKHSSCFLLQNNDFLLQVCTQV